MKAVLTKNSAKILLNNGTYATVTLLSLMSGSSECRISGIISEQEAHEAAQNFLWDTNLEVGNTMGIYADEDSDDGIVYHVPVVIAASSLEEEY